MSSWAVLNIKCDECDYKEEMEMTELFQYSGRSWDTRNVNKELEKYGWEWNEKTDHHICEVCVDKRDLYEDEEAEEAENTLADLYEGDDESKDNI
jgi:hypothetical protein